MSPFYQQRLWSRHRERVSTSPLRPKTPRNAGSMRSATRVRKYLISRIYLHRFDDSCSWSLPFCRSPRLRLVQNLAESDGPGAVGAGRFSDRNRRTEWRVARISFSVFQSTDDGFTAVASGGAQRRGKRQWVELVVEREREGGREQDWARGGGRCVRAVHPGISAFIFSL